MSRFCVTSCSNLERTRRRPSPVRAAECRLPATRTRSRTSKFARLRAVETRPPPLRGRGRSSPPRRNLRGWGGRRSRCSRVRFRARARWTSEKFGLGLRRIITELAVPACRSMHVLVSRLLRTTARPARHTIRPPLPLELRKTLSLRVSIASLRRRRAATRLLTTMAALAQLRRGTASRRCFPSMGPISSRR